MKFSKEWGFAEIFRKIGAYFFDALYVLVLTIAINYAGIAIVKTTSFYNENSALVNQNAYELYSLESEARLIDLYDFDEVKQDEPISQESQYQKYLYRLLLRSDEVSGNALLGENKFDYIPKNTLTLSIDNDYLAYFYVKFIPENPNKGLPEINIEPIDYFNENILKNVNENYFSLDENEYYYLNFDYAKDLYSYLFIDKANQNGETIYNALYDFFNETINDSLTSFMNYVPFKEKYEEYRMNYQKLVGVSVGTNVISYAISFVVLLVVVPIIDRKNHRTLGNLSTKIAPFDYEDKKLSLPKVLLKNLLFFVDTYWINLIVSFFTIGNAGNNFVFFNIGSFEFINFYLMLISMVVLVANIVTGIVNKDKRLLDELMSGTIYLSYKNVRDFSDALKEGEHE